MRSIRYALLFASMVALSMSAAAQEFPTRQVRIVTPFPPGAGPEVNLRIVADRLSKLWGKPVIVENKPGANGFIAVEQVKRAAADGHELLQLDSNHVGAHPFLFKKLPYDLMRDFEPVTPIFNNIFFLTVPTNSPYKSVGDIIAAAKANPGKVDYGSWFIGSPGHLGGAMLEAASGTQMRHIPYKEMTQLYAAVGNAEVPWAFGSVASTQAMVNAGKVKLLAYASPKRNAAMPDIPTVAESGGPANFELMAWVGLFAPKGTSKSIIEKIQRDFATIVREPDMRERFASMHYDPWPMNSEQFAQRIAQDRTRMEQVIKQINITLD